MSEMRRLAEARSSIDGETIIQRGASSSKNYLFWDAGEGELFTCAFCSYAMGRGDPSVMQQLEAVLTAVVILICPDCGTRNIPVPADNKGPRLITDDWWER
jgi:hypothetical protein